jgi:formylmethanofuran dehydrogenase subunit E
MELTAIGRIETPGGEQMVQGSGRQSQIRIHLYHEFNLGLHGLEGCKHIQILADAAQPMECAPLTVSDSGRTKGIFATLHPQRPSGLRVITLRLLGLEDNQVWAQGPPIEAGSLVYDLMPFTSSLESGQAGLEDQEQLKFNPRQDFVRSLCTDDRARLLIKAAEIHGHYCPGIASGVMAAIRGLKALGVESMTFDGIMEDLVAIVEINACFVDGIQAVSGCTLGNNALVFRDLGRMAVTFARRGHDKGFRIRIRPDFRALISRLAPGFYPLMEKVIMQRKGDPKDMADFREQGRMAAFGLIELDFAELFHTDWVSPRLPDYAPISPLVTCPGCNEAVLATKTVRQGKAAGMCFECSDQPAWQVDGRGIVQQ